MARMKIWKPFIDDDGDADGDDDDDDDEQVALIVLYRLYKFALRSSI